MGQNDHANVLVIQKSKNTIISKNPRSKLRGSLLFVELGQLLWEYELAMKATRMKLAAFAPTGVVEALADYFRDNYVPETDDNKCHMNWRADARTYAAMRGELLEGLESRPVDERKLYLLMWNCRPPREN